MDTSETYTKMCEKAVEIQKAYPQGLDNILWHGDIRYSVEKQDFDFIEFNEDTGKIVFSTYDHFKWWAIWLPRQDQLQEICQPIAIDELIRRFYEWYHPWFMSQSAKGACHTSMEQLWLAFVMEQLYNKGWNGEDWEALD